MVAVIKHEGSWPARRAANSVFTQAGHLTGHARRKQAMFAGGVAGGDKVGYLRAVLTCGCSRGYNRN